MVLKEGVDERSQRRTFGEHQQRANQYERDDDRRKPILLVLTHELPQFTDDLRLRHATVYLATKRRNRLIHLFIVAGTAWRIGMPERTARTGAAVKWVPTHGSFH